MDPIMPLTAGALCVNGGLPRDESVALTAAALVIPGALALAPALIAVERQRQANEKNKSDAAAAAAPPKAEDKPPPKELPLLVQVPGVVGKLEQIACDDLAKAKLSVNVVRNRVAGDVKDKTVITQSIAEGSYVNEGTEITLKVNHVPETPPLSEDQKANAEIKEGIGRLDKNFTEVKESLNKGFGELKTSFADLNKTMATLSETMNKMVPTPDTNPKKPA